MRRFWQRKLFAGTDETAEEDGSGGGPSSAQALLQATATTINAPSETDTAQNTLGSGGSVSNANSDREQLETSLTDTATSTTDTAHQRHSTLLTSTNSTAALSTGTAAQFGEVAVPAARGSSLLPSSSNAAPVAAGDGATQQERKEAMMQRLDCTRITDRLYATGMLWRQRTEINSLQLQYIDTKLFSHRNNVMDMARWLNTFHQPRHYLILNLTPSSRQWRQAYDTAPLHHQVLHIPIPARHPLPPLLLLFDLARAMALHLSMGPAESNQRLAPSKQTILLVHCHNGLSRTGVVLSCFLRFAGVFPTANDAFEYFIERRAQGDRGWVTCTQKRYLRYFDQIMDLQNQLLHSSAAKEISIQQLLPNPGARLELSHVIVNLGWLSPPPSEDNSEKRMWLVVEIYELGQLIWSSDINNDGDSPAGSRRPSEDGTKMQTDLWTKPVQFRVSSLNLGSTSTALILQHDFHIRVLLYVQRPGPEISQADLTSPMTPIPPMRVSSSRKSVSKITLAGYTGHCAFLPCTPGNRIRIRRSEVEVGGRVLATARLPVGSGGRQLGDAFFIDLVTASNVSRVSLVDRITSARLDSQPSTRVTSPKSPVIASDLAALPAGPTLGLLKVILNGVPNFDGEGLCQPVLEITQIGGQLDVENQTDEDQARLRKVVYRSSTHRARLVKKYLTNRGRNDVGTLLSIQALDPHGSVDPEIMKLSLKDSTETPPSPSSITLKQVEDWLADRQDWDTDKMGEEDPIYMDRFMILFRLTAMGIPDDEDGDVARFPIENSQSMIELDSVATYEVKLFHRDAKTKALVLMARFAFSPGLMAPGLIRIRPNISREQSPALNDTKLEKDDPLDEESRCVLEEEVLLRDAMGLGDGLELADIPDPVHGTIRRFHDDFSMDLVFTDIAAKPADASQQNSHVSLPDFSTNANSLSSDQEIYARLLSLLSAFSDNHYARALYSVFRFHHIQPDDTFFEILCAQRVPPEYEIELASIPNLDSDIILTKKSDESDRQKQHGLTENASLGARSKSLVSLDEEFSVYGDNEDFDWLEDQVLIPWYDGFMKINAKQKQGEMMDLTSTWHPRIVQFSLQICNNQIHDAHEFLCTSFPPNLYRRIVQESVGRLRRRDVDGFLDISRERIEKEGTRRLLLVSSTMPASAGSVEPPDPFSNVPTVGARTESLAKDAISPTSPILPERSQESLPSPPAPSRLPPPGASDAGPAVPPPPPPPPMMSASGIAGPPPPPPPPMMSLSGAAIPPPPPPPGGGPPPPPPPPGSAPGPMIAAQPRKHVAVSLHWKEIRQNDLQRRQTIWNEDLGIDLTSGAQRSMSAAGFMNDPVLRMAMGRSGSGSRPGSGHNTPPRRRSKTEDGLYASASSSTSALERPSSQYGQWFMKVTDSLDLQKFEDMFCIDPNEQKRKAAASKNNDKKASSGPQQVQLLDLNRAKMVGIVVARFERQYRPILEQYVKAQESMPPPPESSGPVNAEDMARLLLYRQLRHAIMTDKFYGEQVTGLRTFTADELQALKTILPNDQDRDGLELWIKKEMKRWNKSVMQEDHQVMSFDEWVARRLAAPELFLYEVCIKEPNMSVILESRLSKLRFLGPNCDLSIKHAKLEAELKDLQERCVMIQAACERLRQSDALKMLMRTVLSLGNLTNYQYGRRHVGSAGGAGASGFRIESLPKLRDVKSRDGKMTLMNYLVEVLWDIPEILALGAEFKVVSELRLQNTKDIADQIAEFDKSISEVYAWKEDSVNKLLREALQMPLGKDVSSVSILMANVPQMLDVFSAVRKTFLKPMVVLIRHHIAFLKLAYHDMWNAFYETAMYFGEYPEEYDSPLQWSEMENADCKLVLNDNSVDMPASVQSKLALALPGSSSMSRSSSTPSKRPEDLFTTFDTFFNYFNEAIQATKRRKEMERKAKEREERNAEKAAAAEASKSQKSNPPPT